MTSLWVLNLFLMLKLFKFYVFCQTHPLIAGVTFSHFDFIQKKDWKFYFKKYLYQYLWALLIYYNVYSYSPKIIWISHVTSIWHLLVLFNRWITGLDRISGYRIVLRETEGKRDRQAERQTEMKTEIKTDRQKDRNTDREKDLEREIKRDRDSTRYPVTG